MRRFNMPVSLLMLLAISLSCMPSGSYARSEASRHTIEEIQQQVVSGWHQTYDAHGRTIEINCPISVPDVSTFPVLHVRWRTMQFNPANAPEGATAEIGGYGFALIQNNPLDDMVKRSTWELTWYDEPWDMNQAYAYENPLTLGEAVSLAENYITTFGMGTISVALDRFYSAIIKKVNHSTGEFLEMVGDKGYYKLQFYQTMNGIPILVSAGWGVHNTIYNGLGYPKPYAEMKSAYEYVLGGQFLEQVEVIHEDVPLCSFEKVREVVETKIQSGNVRVVESVRLGYILYLDKQDASKIYAVPGWVIRCEYMPTAKEDGFFGADHESLQYSAYYGQIIVNAQTGDMIEPRTKDRSVLDCPKILTWN